MIPFVTAFGSGLLPLGFDVPQLPSIESPVMKQALRQMVGSVSVVTAGEGDERTGATVTSAYGLSVEPPAMMIAINKGSSTYHAIRHFGHFCVNVLADGQEDVANRFSGFGGIKGVERYAGREWTTAVSGAPVLSDALLSIDCVLDDEISKFSHQIFIGRVVDLSERRGPALLYTNGGYGRFERALRPEPATDR